MVIIVVSVIFTAVPMSLDIDTLTATLPITIGAVIFLILGEIVISVCRKGRANL